MEMVHNPYVCRSAYRNAKPSRLLRSSRECGCYQIAHRVEGLRSFGRQACFGRRSGLPNSSIKERSSQCANRPKATKTASRYRGIRPVVHYVGNKCQSRLRHAAQTQELCVWERGSRINSLPKREGCSNEAHTIHHPHASRSKRTDRKEIRTRPQNVANPIRASTGKKSGSKDIEKSESRARVQIHSTRQFGKTGCDRSRSRNSEDVLRPSTGRDAPPLPEVGLESNDSRHQRTKRRQSHMGSGPHG